MGAAKGTFHFCSERHCDSVCEERGELWASRDLSYSYECARLDGKLGSPRQSTSLWKTVLGSGLLPSDWHSGSICRRDDLIALDSTPLGSPGVPCAHKLSGGHSGGGGRCSEFADEDAGTRFGGEWGNSE